MPNHIRKTIRDAVKAKLGEITGLNIDNGRVYDFENNTLPGVIVYSNAEASELDDMSSRDYNRELTLTIEAYHKGKEIDDLLDDLAYEIEIKMESEDLFPFRDERELSSTTMNVNTEGKHIVGAISLTYTIQYTTQSCAPDLSRW